MKRIDRCSLQRKTFAGCHASKAVQTVQPFPTRGPLAQHLGLPLPVLQSEVGETKARTYSYILSSVEIDRETRKFEQHGSAPNFQGGLLTLCTCKHQMRATQAPDDWCSVWVAGVTSRIIHEGKHWLFYLAKIDSAHESHADLWQAMKVRIRNAKAADRHYLGDLFRPKTPVATKNARFSPSRYVAPSVHAHRQHRRDKGWRNDINYRHAEKYRHPPLLAADPRNTFIWDEPVIYFVGHHCRNFYKWSSLRDLISNLREAR